MQKDTLWTAIATAFAVGAVTAHAEVGETGNVLIAPFYGAAAYDDGSANETYLSIVNTQDVTKAVKVRFREGRGSEDSLDFHVYLSPHDIWTAAITQNSDGQTVLVSADTSCTVPALTPNPEASRALFLPTYVPNAYAGDDADLPTAAERVAEGYFEIIEMATFSAGTTRGNYTATEFAWHVEHGADGVPRNCPAAVALNEILWTAGSGSPPSGSIFGGDDAVAINFGTPTGGLFGNAALINVVRGTYKPFEMIALNTLDALGVEPGSIGDALGGDNLFFSQNGTTSSGLLAYTADGGLKNAKSNRLQYWDLPDLSTMPVALATDATPGDSGHLAAVNEALLASAIYNEYVVDEGINARTDWVVTFPTKKFHVTDGDLGTNAQGQVVHGSDYAPVAPFTVAFNETLGQACEPVRFRIWDREEAEETPQQPSGIGFSPGLPGTPEVTALCFEMNVVSINDAETTADLALPSSVLGGTTTRQNIRIEELDSDAGWIFLDLTNNGQKAGLPATGFMAADFENGVINGTLRNYGGTWNHRYERALR